MSRDTVDGGLTLARTIKWFDPVKDFGFIVSDEIDMDVFRMPMCCATLGKVRLQMVLRSKLWPIAPTEEFRPLRFCLLPLPIHLTHLGTEKWTRWMMLPFQR